MSRALWLQQGDQTAEQIRQQVREQVQAAREQAQAAREQARAAREAARQATHDAMRDLQTPQAPDAPKPPTPVIIQAPPLPGGDAVPPQVVDLSIAFFITVAVIILGLPIVRAFTRRLDTRPPAAALDPGVASQLQRIEQTVDSMAIEIERISEAQRFMAKLQSEQGERIGVPPRAGS
jgi:hypothetical protein